MPLENSLGTDYLLYSAKKVHRNLIESKSINLNFKIDKMLFLNVH